MRQSSRAMAITAACLLAAACAAKRPPPSEAVLEARTRAATADSRPKCDFPGPVLGVPFVYGAADLTDEARTALDRAVAWAACTPGAQMALTIDAEYHHRQPDKEKAILTGRQTAVREYLASRVRAGTLLADGVAADPGKPSLTLRGRGW